MRKDAHHYKSLVPLLLHCHMQVIEENLVMPAEHTGFYHCRHIRFYPSVVSQAGTNLDVDFRLEIFGWLCLAFSEMMNERDMVYN